MPELARLARDEQSAAVDDAVELLRPALRDVAGKWTTDYVRLRFCACSTKAR